MQAHAANVKQGIRQQKNGRIIFNFLSEGLSEGDGEKRKAQEQKEVAVSTGRLVEEVGEDGASGSTRVPGEVSLVGAERWHVGRRLLPELPRGCRGRGRARGLLCRGRGWCGL